MPRPDMFYSFEESTDSLKSSMQRREVVHVTKITAGTTTFAKLCKTFACLGDILVINSVSSRSK